MTTSTDEPTENTVPAAPSGYHAPVLVDYGNARNMTRTSADSFTADGGPADEDSGFLDDGAVPSSSSPN